MSKQSQTVQVTLSVDRARFTEVVSAVREAGLYETSEMPRLGIVAGTAPRELLPVLSAIQGVRRIEEDRAVEALR